MLVFDSWRSVILLAVGDKSGQWDKWYRTAIHTDFNATLNLVAVEFARSVPERCPGVVLGLDQAGYHDWLEVADR